MRLDGAPAQADAPFGFPQRARPVKFKLSLKADFGRSYALSFKAINRPFIFGV